MTLSTIINNALVEEYNDGMMIHGENFIFCIGKGAILKREEKEDRIVLRKKDNAVVNIHYLVGDEEQDD